MTDRANKLSSSLSSLLPRVAHAHYVRIPRLSELRLQMQRSAQVSVVRCASIGSDLCWSRQRRAACNGKTFFSLIISGFPSELVRTYHYLQAPKNPVVSLSTLTITITKTGIRRLIFNFQFSILELCQ